MFEKVDEIKLDTFRISVANNHILIYEDQRLLEYIGNSKYEVLYEGKVRNCLSYKENLLYLDDKNFLLNKDVIDFSFDEKRISHIIGKYLLCYIRRPRSYYLLDSIHLS